MKLLKYPVVLGLAALSLTTAFAKHPSLIDAAKISESEAAKTALASVPLGKIKESELEEESGKLVWSFDITTPKSKNITEVQVDAITGKIVSTEIETPADQAKEAAEDAAKK